MKLSSYATQVRNIENLLNKATSALSNLDVLYEMGSTKTTREIIGSMFHESLVFDGTQLRTANVNEAAHLIYLINNELGNLVRADKEIVLPAQGHRPYCVLHTVVVDAQVPVIEVV